jgi:hypothetical protein
MADGPLVIRISGMENLRAITRDLRERAPIEFGQAIREEMDDAMMESQAECPYDHDNPHFDGTPHMRDTAKVEGPIFSGDQFTIYASYDTPYAPIVHENPDVRHHWPTKWKFLEDPINRRVSMLTLSLKSRFDSIMSGVLMRASFSPEGASQRDYYKWLHGTLGGMNTARSWGKSFHTGNVYPIRPNSNQGED